MWTEVKRLWQMAICGQHASVCFYVIARWRLCEPCRNSQLPW